MDQKIELRHNIHSVCVWGGGVPFIADLYKMETMLKDKEARVCVIKISDAYEILFKETQGTRTPNSVTFILLIGPVNN